jgi:D-beta-D-heptose 7-phosphate kinase/D-beta-D-heptose 1-phosphate adenosyltransferase
MRAKIISRDEAAKLSSEYRASGKRVGFTSGVFDILHPGHVEYLEDSRSRVDVLFVGLNSDASVKANKGESRPIC